MTTKERLVQLLKASSDWVSGENLSQQLGVSRMAIAKHIASLRNEEYLIESAPRRGYLFKLAPDIIDIDVIKKMVNTRIIGKGDWLLVEKTYSTSQEAILLAAKGAPDGSIVIAQKQTNGKGRKGKEWFSSPRSAHFSIVLRPTILAKKLPIFSVIATLAVQKTLAHLEKLDAIIKWPNDVLINGRKIAGILVETGFIEEEIEWIVIGIGCNLNTENSEFPERIREYVTSTLEESQKYCSRNLFYQNVIEWLDHYYHLLLEEKEVDIMKEYDKVGQKITLPDSYIF